MMRFTDTVVSSAMTIVLGAAATFCIGMPSAWCYEPKTLEIGSHAPDFDLVGIDDQRYTLADFAESSVFVVVFTTNHCPDAIASYQRLIQMVNEYQEKSVGFVAINGNDPLAVRLDEMRWTNYDDTFESMKIVAAEEGFNLPYLYDGETQQVTKAYGAVATPHVFVFDKQRRLKYTGRLDNGRRNPGPADKSEARDAIDALLAGRAVPRERTRVFGCSIKWSDKRALVARSDEEWKKRPVKLALADLGDIKKLVANQTDSLRLINVWSTSCGPCIREFPALVSDYRRFQNHPFELITISVDSVELRDHVAGLLEENHVATAKSTENLLARDKRETNNLLYSGDDLEDLATALDPEWSGAQPHTLLVAPGGEVLFRQTDSIELDRLRAAIVKYVRAKFLK